MIAKFKTSDGAWLVYQGKKIIYADRVYGKSCMGIGELLSRQFGGRINPGEVDEIAVQTDHRPVKDGCGDVKYCRVEYSDGSYDVIGYNQEAYLMNDNGDTICRL